jgi:Fe2+ or Zn2+ uptake regulation protein
LYLGILASQMARPSHVRNAVRAALSDSSRHDWSIDDVLAELRARDVRADFSSVYRALEFLESEGAVSRVELGDGKARFEATHGHHEHVRCDSCGAVAAVPGCLLESARPRVERLTGFSITGHNLLFSGLCAGCRERGA